MLTVQFEEVVCEPTSCFQQQSEHSALTANSHLSLLHNSARTAVTRHFALNAHRCDHAHSERRGHVLSGGVCYHRPEGELTVMN